MAKAETIPVLEFPQARHVQELPALDHIRDLALAWKQMQAAHSAWYRKHEPDHARQRYGSEEWIRAEVEKKALVMAVVDARTAYERACDDFFLRESEQRSAAE